MRNILTPKRTQIVSADQYLQATHQKNQRDNIKHIRFIPPKIGADDFGHFEITYKIPVLMSDSQ